MRKRLISWLLVLTMVVGMLPSASVPVYAAEQQTTVTEETVKPEETVTPEETVKPEETVTPEETVKPEETVTPEETVKPEETVTPEEAVTPEETAEPEAAAVSESAPEKETRVATSDVVIGEETAGYTYKLLDKAPMKTSAIASSQQSKDAAASDGPAGNAFDGDAGTAWHTKYSDAKDDNEYTIEWNLTSDQSAVSVGKLVYQPKRGGHNGRWANINIQVQKADDSWTSVYKDTLEELPKSGEFKATINFTPVEAKAMKVSIISSYKEDGKHYAQAGEIEVYEAISDEQSSTAKTVEIPQSILAKYATATSSKDPVEWGDGGATLAFDNDLGTAWHAAYDNAKYPISIEFNVDESPDMCQKISKMTIQSKRNGDNGNIKAGVVSVLNAKGQWEDVRDLEYTEAERWNEHTIDMGKNVVGSKIRITVTDAWNDDTSLKVANIGEIHVWKVDEPGVPGEPQIDYNEKLTYTINNICVDEENVAGNRDNSRYNATLIDAESGTKIGGGEPVMTTQGGHFPTKYSYTLEVPKYIGQKEARWSVLYPGGDDLGRAEGENEVYETTIVQNGPLESTITFTADVRRVSRTVRVNWVNIPEKDRTNLTVGLNKSDWYDGLPFNYGDDVELTAENNYTYTWTEIPVYKERIKNMYEPCFSIDPIEANVSLDNYKITYSRDKSENKDVYYFDPTLVESEIVVTIAKPADKIALQKLYDEVKDFTADTTWMKDFTKALEKAKKVLDNADATQEEVDDAYETLEKMYWLSKHGGYLRKYRYTDSSSAKRFPYENYTQESVIPVIRVYLESQNAGNNTSLEDLKKWCAAFEEAEKGLNLLPEDPKGVWGGPTPDLVDGSKNFKGTFTITETPAENGQVKLHVEFINDGINPYTGKDCDKYAPHEMGGLDQPDCINVRYGYKEYALNENGYHPEGMKWGEPQHPDGERDFYNGFQMDIVVNPGRYYIQLDTMKNHEVTTAGYYYTRESVTVTTSVDGTETKLPLFKGEALGDQFPADPTKDGYVFMGWNTKADGSGTVVTKDTKFDANATVYALFKEELHAKADYSNVKDGKTETVYNGKVTVTITTNKDVPNLDGWKKVNDRTFTKVFAKNAEETVVLRDVDGFECTVNVKVEGIVIDHTNPTIQVDKDGTVTVKDDNLSKVTVDGKEVTLDKNGQFVLSEGEHTIVAVDKAGNSVTWVGKIGGSGSGNSQKPEDDKKPGQGSDDSQQGGNAQQQTGGQAAGSQSAKTGDQAQIGLYVVLLLGCAAVIGVLIYKKKKN